MDYDEFTKRTWIVKKYGEVSKCTEGDIITFDGPEKKVAIRCKRYEDAEYSNGIIKGPDFEIQMTLGTGNTPEIEFTPKGENAIGGSWTAEDNTSGPAPDPRR